MSASGGGGGADPPGGDAVVKRKERHKSCACCKKPGARLKCEACLQRTYCDRKCQKEDWKALHKKQCKKLQKSAPAVGGKGESVGGEEIETRCPICLDHDDDAHVGGSLPSVCYACGQSFCGACNAEGFERRLHGCPICRAPTVSAEGNFVRCRKLLRTRSPGRHTKQAQAFVGKCYMHGMGVAQDDARAFKWFKRAADNGHGPAMVVTASFYLGGVGVAKDVATGVEYLQRGAEITPAGSDSNAAAKQSIVCLQECGIIPAPRPGATA